MTELLGFWSHALAGVLYAFLALWQLHGWGSDPRSRRLSAAFGATAAWAVASAVLGSQHMVPLLLSCARTFVFLSFMYALLQTARSDNQQRAVKVVYFTVAAVIGLQVTITGVLPKFEDVAPIHSALMSTAHFLGLIVAAGCLVLVHNVYSQASPDSRWNIRLPMIGLAG